MATKKQSTKRTKAPHAATRHKEMRSFRLEKDTVPFTKVGLTRQTAYWTLLIVVIVVLQLWILKQQMDIAELTNSLLLIDKSRQ